MLVTASGDKTIRIWDTRGKCWLYTSNKDQYLFSEVRFKVSDEVSKTGRSFQYCNTE